MLLLPLLRPPAARAFVTTRGWRHVHCLANGATLRRLRVPSPPRSSGWTRALVSTSGSSGPAPATPAAHARVLIFDEACEPAVHALSRAEVLRITQDAASSAVDDGATPFRCAPFGLHSPSSSPPARRASTFETIVDVQRVHARDIRQLDSAFAVRSEPSVEVRDQAILVNADPIRAIIMRHRCLVFLHDGDLMLRPMLEDVFHEVAAGTDDAGVAYEFQALEALLGALCRHYHGEFDRVAPAIATSLGRLTAGHSATGELNTLRGFKNTMNEFQSRVDGVRRALMATLNNEEDLRLLYLSKLHADRALLSNLWSFDSEEAEVLIENYLQDIYALQTTATLLQQRIQNAETVVKLRLDAMRNYLLGVNILFSVAGISLSLGTFTVGVFGMNLLSGLETAPGWFAGVAAFSTTLMAATGLATVRFFRRKGVFGSVPQGLADAAAAPIAAPASLPAKATTTATTAAGSSPATKKANL